MQKKTIYIIAGVVVVAGAGYWLVNRQNTLSKTGPSYSLPPAGSSGGVQSGANQVYSSQAGLTIRTSPDISNGFLGMFGNVFQTVNSAGIWVGTKIAVTPDSDSAINPVTGNIFNWYQVRLAPNFNASGSTYFVREDYVTVR